MNSKRAKAIRRLANECGIGYQPLKNLYNKLGRSSDKENKELSNKLYENNNFASKPEQTTTSSKDS
jgi:hypothetical protein